MQATKILLVEDDPLIYRMYQKAFELEGFTVEIAEDGQKGLEKLTTFQPSIILLDIMMPNMNGVEMLAHLKENPATKDIPTVVLTNVSDLRTNHEIYEKGANLALIKSENDPDQVIAWIKSVLEKANGSPAAPTTEQPTA
jgi:CheY-like chemotaxis protein